MIDWIKTVQGIAALIFATVVAWWNLGLPRLVFSPELGRFTAGSRRSSSSTATPGS